jgi:hypothetical protein
LTTNAPSRARPKIGYCLRICRQGLAHHDGNLIDLTDAELQEYATLRFIRDAYVHDPKGVAADLRKYRNSYSSWWEEWRSQGR